jgi:hypothetical protein
MWVKSSYSFSNGNCVELWRKSRRSNFSGNCVEVAAGVRVRDSVLAGASPVLTFPVPAWAAFLRELKTPVTGRRS